jgi:hypothetical protein
MSSPFLMHRVFPPSKPPDGGCPPSFRLIVGGTQLRGSWYLSAIVRLQGFSSCSPAAPLRRRSPKMVTSGLMVGRASRAAASAPPSASRIFVIQAKMEDEASRSRPLRGRRPAVRRSSVAPQAHPNRVGLFVPAEGGTGVPFVMALRMPVFCSLRLSGPEHVCNFGTEPCFFLIFEH